MWGSWATSLIWETISSSKQTWALLWLYKQVAMVKTQKYLSVEACVHLLERTWILCTQVWLKLGSCFGRLYNVVDIHVLSLFVIIFTWKSVWPPFEENQIPFTHLCFVLIASVVEIKLAQRLAGEHLSTKLFR